jgi:hypothetical protein
MASSPTSERHDLGRLRRAVLGDERTPGLATVLPLLQTSHREEIRREERWSKEELVRHPEPRQLIRAMRKPGNLDAAGRPLYTLDERRFVTADIRENRFVKWVVEDVRESLVGYLDDDPAAAPLLHELDRAIARASFLKDVGDHDRRDHEPTPALTRDPHYRAVLSLRP